MPKTRSKNKTSKSVKQVTQTSSTSEPPATAGKKRQKTNSNGTTHGKRKKARSLTTADIPDIVTAVVESLPQRGVVTPASTQIDQRTTRKATTRTSRTAEKSSQSSRHQSPGSSRLHREVSPSSEPEENSDEDANNEEFGKSNRIQCGNVA